MAVQLKVEELKGCQAYIGWLRDRIFGYSADGGVAVYDEISEELTRYLQETDFEFTVEEDGIRARDAMDMRKIYAEAVGQKHGKSEKEIDRIWKSVHGKCSVLELFVSLCSHMDAMVNEGESGAMIPDFYRIIMHNLKLDIYDDKDYDLRENAVKVCWKVAVERFMQRKYRADGSDGGLFPLKFGGVSGVGEAAKDMREVPIWYQMNAWLEENLDEDGVFLRPE